MSTMNTVSERIDSLIQIWNEKLKEKNKNENINCPTTLSREDGRKYVKLIRNGPGTSRSAYGFINKETGDIFMAASWKIPAKHVRGNVNNDDFGMNCCGPYGIDYLRGGNISW